ncbi:hypothetical protein M422DRAFT_198471 [Sphaerobolus stellatus SS14]|nr:hypothetical protein M422DRAFT_198471 [Sphaerobolus stellatus SS14]
MFRIKQTGQELSVEYYYRRTYRQPLSFPNIICVRTAKGAVTTIFIFYRLHCRTIITITARITSESNFLSVLYFIEMA